MTSRPPEPAGEGEASHQPLQCLGDAALAGRLVAPPLAASPEGSPLRQALEAELRRRVGRSALRRLLEGYASAAPEYIDEDTQAAARLYLARLKDFADTQG